MAAGLTDDVALRLTREGLEGDGIASRLFELLWKRDLLSDSSVSLRIPDTVIFKHNVPTLWYFTSVDGTIKRKTKAKVTNGHILKEFRRRPSPSGVAACFVTNVPAQAKPVAGDDDEDEACGGLRTTIEYLDHQGLEDFLLDNQRVRGDGILQRFVEPKGGRNNMLRALWSPKVCLLERRVNRLQMGDTRYDMYERAVTFEGAEFYSDLAPVRGAGLVTKVHEIADSMVQHVAGVTNDRIMISRLALNFKVDDRDRLWLLFASSVRLRDELKKSAKLSKADATRLAEQGFANTPLELNLTLQVPQHVRQARTTSRPVVLQCKCRCPICSDLVADGEFFDIPYKLMIEYEEQQAGSQKPLPEAENAPWPMSIEEVAQSSGSNAPAQDVPEVFRILHPRLTAEEYSRYRHDMVFLYRTVAICEACYVRYSSPQLGDAAWWGTKAEAAKETLAMDEIPDASLAGTQDLEPQRLRQRRDVTQQRIRSAKAQEAEWWRELELQQNRELSKAKRTQSCPKLPSWGPGASAAASWPPAAPVLAVPPAPGSPAPHWSSLRPEQARSPKLRRPPDHRRVAPLSSEESYIREVQLYVAQCGGRASEFLAASMASAKAAKVAAAQKAASRPRNATQGSNQSMLAMLAEDAGAETDPMRLTEDETSDSFVGSDSEGEHEHEQLLAKAGSKWPPAGRSTRGSSATTTVPLSGPSSRPSTRPSSRGTVSGSSASALHRLQRLAAQRQDRPTSSPQTHSRHHGRPESSPSARHGRPERPRSSPQPERRPPSGDILSRFG